MDVHLSRESPEPWFRTFPGRSFAEVQRSTSPPPWFIAEPHTPVARDFEVFENVCSLLCDTCECVIDARVCVCVCVCVCAGGWKVHSRDGGWSSNSFCFRGTVYDTIVCVQCFLILAIS